MHAYMVQVVLGMGVITLAGYAVHTMVTPYVTSLYRAWSDAAREKVGCLCLCREYVDG